MIAPPSSLGGFGRLSQSTRLSSHRSAEPSCCPIGLHSGLLRSVRRPVHGRPQERHVAADHLRGGILPGVAGPRWFRRFAGRRANSSRGVGGWLLQEVETNVFKKKHAIVESLWICAICSPSADQLFLELEHRPSPWPLGLTTQVISVRNN